MDIITLEVKMALCLTKAVSWQENCFYLNCHQLNTGKYLKILIYPRSQFLENQLIRKFQIFLDTIHAREGKFIMAIAENSTFENESIIGTISLVTALSKIKFSKHIIQTEKTRF